MSCMDSVTDVIANVVGEIVSIGARGIRTSIKAVAKATSVAIRAVAFVGTALSEAFRDMVERKQISAERRQTAAFHKLEQLHNLQTLGFKNIDKTKVDFACADEAVAEEVDRAISVLRDELAEYEAFKSFIFPDGLYEEILQLTSIDVFYLSPSGLKNVVEQIGVIRGRLSDIDERGKAVICAVNGEVYEPSNVTVEFATEAVQSAYERLVGMYREFEGTMVCAHRLPQERIGMEVTDCIEAVTTEVEAQSELDAVKRKERA